MSVATSTRITVSAIIARPVAHVWKCWIGAEHIVYWNNASDDWHCPAATNDTRAGGKFNYTMAARDGSMSFDFIGTYTEVVPGSRIAYTIADGRKVELDFATDRNGTRVTEIFDPETENTLELQREGWQAILDNFKTYAEAQD